MLRIRLSVRGMIALECAPAEVPRFNPIRAGKSRRHRVSNLISPPRITERLLDSDELAGLLTEAIAGNYTICFNAPGQSMHPFIHSGDKIFISPVTTETIRLGDILAIVCPSDDRVLVHRVVKIQKEYYFTKGDNVASSGDGWIDSGKVLGRVTRIEREGVERRLGLGMEKQLIALLSRGNYLVPMLNFYRRVKQGIAGLFSS